MKQIQQAPALKESKQGRNGNIDVTKIMLFRRIYPIDREKFIDCC